MNCRLPALAALFPLLAACGTNAGEKSSAPAYVDEAPLPKGWPQPGPYQQVALKHYPAYRAAFVGGKRETGAFWTLFGHIKKHDIPMTAPVEMAMNPAGESLDMASMAFLYQDQSVGKAGPDGTKVEVRDVPAAKALSYAWQGEDSPANLAAAKTALDAELAKRHLTSRHFRLLGYNGPATPRAKRTWELQALP